MDVNGDGKVDAGDRTYMGSPIPGFYYGINGSMGWMGFDFSFLLQGVGDIQVYNAARRAMESMSGGSNQFTSVLDRWDGEGSTNEMPRATQSDPNGNNRPISDRWIEDADFLRIRNIQIGYTPPSDWLERTTGGFISSIRAYIGLQNLATFTGYSGYDPEVTRAQSFQKGEFPLATGQDGGASPQPRINQLGWQIIF